MGASAQHFQAAAASLNARAAAFAAAAVRAGCEPLGCELRHTHRAGYALHCTRDAAAGEHHLGTQLTLASCTCIGAMLILKLGSSVKAHSNDRTTGPICAAPPTGARRVSGERTKVTKSGRPPEANAPPVQRPKGSAPPQSERK